MRYEIKELEDYSIINCYNNGKLLGYLSYKFSDNQAWLFKIKVNKNARNLGIGSTLIKIFENECLDSYKKVVEGKFYPEDEECKVVKSFYNKNGYDIFKEGYETLIFKRLENRPDINNVNITNKKSASR